MAWWSVIKEHRDITVSVNGLLECVPQLVLGTQESHF